MKNAIEEFLAVVDSSWEVTIGIVLTVIIPAIILLLGSWIVSDIEFPPPLDALDVIRQPILYGVLAFALITFCKLAYATHLRYVATRKRFFGY